MQENNKVRKIIRFKCPNLEKAVRQADGFTGASQGEIYDLDVQQIKVLKAESSFITSLEGIENLSSLVRLSFPGNYVSDITPLKELKQLSSLDLSRNQVSDITPITGLTQLDYLDFSSNKVSDITSLKELKQLSSLDLSHNDVNDITPLLFLSNLKTLRFFNKNLDLSQESKSMQDIQSLTAHGVKVQFEENKKRSDRGKKEEVQSEEDKNMYSEERIIDPEEKKWLEKMERKRIERERQIEKFKERLPKTILIIVVLTLLSLLRYVW